MSRLLLAFSLICAIGQAQTFEVASVKPHTAISSDLSLNFTPGGGLNMSNGTVRLLIWLAYNVREDQLSGGPAWIDSEHYDIVAKAPEGTKLSNTTMPAPGDPVYIRVRNLLAERFHLTVHHETKEMSMFALVQDKGGAKLAPAKETDPSGASMRMDSTTLSCRRYTMDLLASNILARRMGAKVVDKTGIAGEFTFVLTYVPDPPPGRDAIGDRPAGLTFLEALREQLGLKIERQKGPADVLVIDHVEKPDAN